MREKVLSFGGHGDCVFFTKGSHMSRKLGIGETPFHDHVMSGDIDDIQDDIYHVSRRTLLTQVKMNRRHYRMYVGLHGPSGVYVPGIPPRGDLPP